MVNFALKLSGNVENINELHPDNDRDWSLKLQCRSCNEVDERWHSVSPNESVQAKSGPNTFNFQMKCKFCSNVFTIDVVKDSAKTVKSNDNDRIEKQSVIAFDCRGVEPIDFDPQCGWTGYCEETGSKFTDVDFTEENCWTGYDEKGNFPVSVDQLTWEFSRL